MSSKTRFFLADEIFNMCILEIIRQVSEHCFERGELLMQI